MKYILILITLFLLVACSGAKTNNSGVENAFTSWNASPPNSAVNFTAGNSSSVSSVGSISQQDSSISGSMNFDSSRNLNSATFTPFGGTTITFSIANGSTIFLDSSGGNYFLKDKAGSTIGITPNPYLQGFQYQTYGAWGPAVASGSGGGSGTSTLTTSYAISIGSATAGSAIPVVGSATFTGAAGGYYYVSASQTNVTSASMSATVNFSSRSINFSTSNTSTVNSVTGGYANAASLNLAGTMSYAAGSGRFSGPVTTTGGGALQGNLLGAFYGPNANEIGGTFSLNSPTGATFIGGFGGKR